jgi:hypothetical protein
VLEEARERRLDIRLVQPAGGLVVDGHVQQAQHAQHLGLQHLLLLAHGLVHLTTEHLRASSPIMIMGHARWLDLGAQHCRNAARLPHTLTRRNRWQSASWQCWPRMKLYATCVLAIATLAVLHDCATDTGRQTHRWPCHPAMRSCPPL